MDKSDFQPSCPGRLEPTSFIEKRFTGGSVALTEVKGLGFVPDPLPPEIDHGELLIRLQNPLLKAERNLSQLDAIARDLENPYLLIGPFVTREAKLSSAIENTFASAEQLMLFDYDPAAVELQSRGEVLEVSNYVRALHHGYQSELPISRRLILEMHRILLNGVKRDAGIPGEFRKTQNAIGTSNRRFSDARFVPPPPRFLDKCINDLEKYFNEDSCLPRLVEFAFAHYQFECIHPFDDGNGRLGRLLIALQLCKRAQLTAPLVYVSGFFEQNRQEYYDHLFRVSSHGEWIEWTEFFITAVATQAEDACERAKRLLRLRQQYHLKVRVKRASALLPKIIDRLFEQPVITVSKAAELTGTTAQAAGKHIKNLVAKGILYEATGRESHRIYVAPEIISAIES